MEYEKELSEMKQNCKLLNDAEESGPITDGTTVRVGGIISSVKVRPIKNGSGMMATGILEDMNGTVEFLAFPTVYQKCAQLLLKDKRVIMTGRLSMREDKPNTVMVDDVVPLIKLDMRRLALNFTAETEPLRKRVIEALRRCPGNMEVVFANSVTRKQELAPRELSVHNSEELLSELRGLLGGENVKLIVRK
jgi:DNA polymerase-3 subunit alpha